MAEMISGRNGRVGGAGLVLILAAGALAQEPVPPEGIQAETEKRWEDAVRIYRSAIDKAPGRCDLWLRIADIEAALGHRDAAAEATRRAAELKPDDAPLHFRLAQAYSMADKPEQALEAVEQAVKLSPANIEYLRARAQYANWVGKTGLAAESYERILALAPGDDDARLNLARARSWQGRLETAVRAFKSYLKAHPDDKDATMDYVKAQTWRGNFAGSLDLLEDYRRRFGETPDYLKQKVRVLATAGRPTEALPVIDRLLADSPNDYELRFSRTVALHYDRQPREALESLKDLDRLRPASPDTAGIRRFVSTPLRSCLTLGSSFYHESDSLSIFRSYLEGRYQSDPATRWLAGTERYVLSANEGSGLEADDGSEHVWLFHSWVGVGHRYSRELDLELRIGASQEDSDHSTPTYLLTAAYQPRDNLQFVFQSSYGFFIVSPRTVSLDIRDFSNSVRMIWEPSLRDRLDASFGYDDLTDGNARWTASLAHSHTLLRSQHLNLDAGPAISWTGFEHDLGHGYYDPHRSRRLAMNLYAYWKLGENDGIGIVVSPGWQKDSIGEEYLFGWNADVEGRFGVYRDWMLRLRAGITRNVSGAGGAGGPDNRFQATIFEAALTRRF